MPILSALHKEGTTETSIKAQLYLVTAGHYDLVDEVSGITIAPNATIDLQMEWNTGGQDAGSQELQLWVIASEDDRALANAGFKILLTPPGVVYVLMGAQDRTRGHIVGVVAQPQVATPPEYPPTPTPTATPAPTIAPRIDVDVVGISSTPVATAIKGQWVNIEVRVRNNGNVKTKVPVRLTFPSASKKPEIKRVALRPGESGVATFIWKTRNYDVGNHRLSAQILLDNNAATGRTSASLSVNLIEPVITASIEGVTLTPESAVVGDPVTISVTVRNAGLFAANIPVTLHFPSTSKQPETRKPRTEPGRIATAQFTWRTGRYAPGDHTFKVTVPTAETDFIGTLLAPTADFEIVEMYGPDKAMAYAQGDRVEVGALVRNNGPQAGRASIAFHHSASNVVLDDQSLTLEPGESETVGFAWNTSEIEPGAHSLRVKIESAKDPLPDNNVSTDTTVTLISAQDIAVADQGTMPNSQVRDKLTATELPDLPRLSIGQISFRPEKPVVGDPVSIAVEIINKGGLAGRAPITLHFPSEAKQPETRSPLASPSQNAFANFTWRTGRYRPGVHEFQVEGIGLNRTFKIELHPPTVDFAVSAIYPPHPEFPIAKGDWVEVAAFIRNLGTHDGRAKVSLRDVSRHNGMYNQSVSLKAGESRIVEFTWKTLRYDAGDYWLIVDAQADHDTDPTNNHSEPAWAQILTNRDITLGFGGQHPRLSVAQGSSKPRLRVEARYPSELDVWDSSHATISDLRLPRISTPFRPAPAAMPNKPSAVPDADPAPLTTTSPFLGAVQQRRTGDLHPRSLLCPGAPALVR